MNKPDTYTAPDGRPLMAANDREIIIGLLQDVRELLCEILDELRKPKVLVDNGMPPDVLRQQMRAMVTEMRTLGILPPDSAVTEATAGVDHE